jgi:hypothetical protein
MDTQIEFVSLDVEDFRQFSGRQHFEFAGSEVDGSCGLTLVLGGGASGKTSFCLALELALWGHRQVFRPHPWLWRWVPPRLDPTVPQTFISHPAAQQVGSQAKVRLRLRATAPSGARTFMSVTRTWRLERSGRIGERLWLSVRQEGARAERLYAAAAQAELESVVSPRRPPLIFSDTDQVRWLGRVLTWRKGASERSLRELDHVTRQLGEAEWRAIAPTVIAVANRMLVNWLEVDDLWLMPEEAARRCPGAYQLVPGVWASSELGEGHSRYSCIGLAAIAGLHRSGRLQAPLVLDAPALTIEPGPAAAWLDAVYEAGGSQLIVAAHECAIEFPALSLGGRASWVYLVEVLNSGRTVPLNDWR